MTDCTVAQEVRGGLRLGDLVRFNERAPYYGDWIGVDLKVVSLRLDPSGKQWVSGIEGDQKHRGNGVYDAETTDIDAEYLDLVHRAHPQPAAGAERPFACKECGALYSHEPTCSSPVRSGLEEEVRRLRIDNARLRYEAAIRATLNSGSRRMALEKAQETLAFEICESLCEQMDSGENETRRLAAKVMASGRVKNALRAALQQGGDHE